MGRIFASEIWGAYFRKGFFSFGGGGGRVRIIGIYGNWILKTGNGCFQSQRHAADNCN